MTPEQVALLLQQHPGKDQGLSASDLVKVIEGRTSPSLERQLREIVTALRDRGLPICAHPNYGYWWAEDAAEVHRTRNFLQARAMNSLRLVSKLKRIAIPLLEGQMSLPLLLEEEPIQVEHKDYSVEPKVSSVVKLPEPLVLEMQEFLLQHPDMDRDDLLTVALAWFLECEGFEIKGVSNEQ